MKKNLTKLALSGAALAAVAATLGTSTYAWYTTNPTVSANNIVGASSDSGASSIYISRDTTTKNWASSVTLKAEDFNAAKLVPVQPATGKFTTLKGTDAASTDVLTFSLWFKSSKVADEYVASGTGANGIDLYIKDITIANTTTTLPTADNLLYGDTTYAADDYGVSNSAATYSVNFVNALGMRIVDTTDSTSAVTKQTFALDQWETSASKTGKAGTVSTGKAHAYYNEVMEDDLASGDITAGKLLTSDYTKTAVTTLNPTGTNATARKLTFYVYLNGWNDFCYDACQGQSFEISLAFTKDATAALDAKARS